jgi:hypothetical protein
MKEEKSELKAKRMPEALRMTNDHAEQMPINSLFRVMFDPFVVFPRKSCTKYQKASAARLIQIKRARER